MKLTPIYPAHIKPVRTGVYKVWFYKSRGSYFAHWNGTHWGIGNVFRDEAKPYIKSKDRITVQDKRWQGLATKDGK